MLWVNRRLGFDADEADNRIMMQDQARTTYWTYDALNRMTSVTDPYGTVASYEYTPGGQLLKRTLGNGAVR